MDIVEHQIIGGHGREYANALVDETQPPRLSVKQYRPRRNPTPRPGDPSFILAGGIGFIKEAYEALIEDVDAQLAARNVRVRNYWIADMYCVGASALLNAGNLGNAPSWFDHSRDLLALVNHFRDEMPYPLIGLGHSMGGAQIAHLSLLHPRLLHSIVLIEPAMYLGLEKRMLYTQARGMAKRRETLAEPAKARASIDQSPFYQTWDARSRQALLKNAYVDAKTGERADLTQSPLRSAPVRTTTPRDIEVSLLQRPNYGHVGSKELSQTDALERQDAPDVDPGANYRFPFYRGESISAYRRIQHIRAGVLYVCGGQSASSRPAIRQHRLETTGTDVGGSGGLAVGRVREVVIPDGGHMIAMDQHLPRVAEGIASFVEEELQLWKTMQDRVRRGSKADAIMLESFQEWKPGAEMAEIAQRKMSEMATKSKI